MSTFYVSAAAANGIPAGSDLIGDGSIEHPWASIGKANSAAADGDTVYLNDGVYTSEKTLEITNAVSWQSVTDYGATILATPGQSRVIGISEDLGGTVTLGKIVIDGGNTATSLIVVNNQATTYSLELDGTHLVNPTSFGIQGTSAGARANIEMHDVEMTATSALSMLNISSLLDGSVNITGGSVDIANVWRAGYGGIATVNASSADLTATISGVTANLHATGTSATANGQGIYYGIRLTDVAHPLIEYNDITQTGTSADQTGYTVIATYDKNNPYDISDGIIRYNTLRNDLDGSAGKIILVGMDADPGAALRNYANDYQIYGNSGFGDDGAEAAKLHGILVGWQDGAQVYDNSLDYTSLAYVLKGMTGETLVFDNTDTHTSSKSLYQKGGADVQFLYNTSYEDDDFNPDIINIGDAAAGAYLATGAVIIGNTLVYTGEPDSFLSVFPGSSTAVISGNNYYAATGNSSNAWIYEGTTYKTIAAWQAAVEADATYSGQVSIGQGAILTAMGISGQATDLIGMVAGVQTYAITFTIGFTGSASFAIGNMGAAGAAAISGLIDAEITSASLSALADALYGPLGSREMLQFSISYDGLDDLDGQVLHVIGNYTNTKPIDILFEATVAPASAGDDTIYGSNQGELLDGLDGNDTIFGRGGDDQLLGGAGNDMLDGGLGADRMVGGLGDDTFIVDNSGDLAVETIGQGTDIVLASVSYSLAGQYIENLTLTGPGAINGTGNSFANLIIGNDAANILSGGDGNDTLMGGAGNDTLAGGNGNDFLDGGTGIDRMEGGAGDDTFIVDMPGDLAVETIGQGTDIVLASVSYSLVGQYIENLTLTGAEAINGTGNSLDNLIIGNDAANTLSGGDGSDTLIGGAGDDTLKGGNGNDLLDGGTGIDRMEGGAGNDTFIVDAPGDLAVEAIGQGTDTVLALVTYSLAGQYIENLTLTGTEAINGTGNSFANLIIGNDAANILSGGAGNDTLLGGAGNDTLSGGSGNDLLDGGTGIDRMEGGAGDDTFIVDTLGDLAVETQNGGTDRVLASVTYSLAGQYVENLTLTGTEAINGTGNSQANLLIGNDAANILDGGANNDTLQGGLGADTLKGGTGADLFCYATAAEGGDTILDFTIGQDHLQISAGGFGGGLSGAALTAAQFTSNTTGLATAANGMFIYQTDLGTLWWDADGTGAAEHIAIATFSTLPSLSASDIQLIG